LFAQSLSLGVKIMTYIRSGIQKFSNTFQLADSSGQIVLDSDGNPLTGWAIFGSCSVLAGSMASAIPGFATFKVAFMDDITLGTYAPANMPVSVPVPATGSIPNSISSLTPAKAFAMYMNKSLPPTDADNFEGWLLNSVQVNSII